MHQRHRDDMGRELVTGRAPMRIVSLVPSETATLFALGLGDRVVGRTSYCVEPVGAVESIPTVGGTKDVDADAVLALSPDLILANQEENARGPLSKLADARLPVFVSFPKTVAESVAHVARVVRLCRVEGDPIAGAVVRDLYQLVRQAADGPALRTTVFVPIWLDPWMTFSEQTYASDLLRLCGADNVFADRTRRYPLKADLALRSPLAADQDGARDIRYPRISFDEVVERAPELVLLPDEPYEFDDSDVDVVLAKLGGTAVVEAVSGRHLFWQGSTLLEALPAVRAQVARVASDSRGRN